MKENFLDLSGLSADDQIKTLTKISQLLIDEFAITVKKLEEELLKANKKVLELIYPII